MSETAGGTAARVTLPGLEPGGCGLETGRLLFARPCTFLRGVAELSQLPPPDLPEVAFAGRSNVGKSSLVNGLTGRKTLARTSNTPGRTQEINLFEIDDRLRLADLPGYGYAEAPRHKVAAWTALVFDFLRGRPNLRLVCLLVDARHGATERDRAAMAELGRAAVPFLTVLTKTDLVGSAALAERTVELAAFLRRQPAALETPLPTSARLRTGFEELRAVIASFARPARASDQVDDQP